MGLCVSGFDSSGELVAHPEIVGPGVPDGSGTKFEIGCTKSCDEDPGGTRISPMDILSSLFYFYDISKNLG